MERFELTATPWNWRLTWAPELVLARMPTRMTGSFDRGNGRTAIDFTASPAPDFYWIIGLQSVMPVSIAAIFSYYLPSLMWIWIAFLSIEIMIVAALVISARRSIAYCKRVMEEVFSDEKTAARRPSGQPDLAPSREAPWGFPSSSRRSD